MKGGMYPAHQLLDGDILGDGNVILVCIGQGDGKSVIARYLGGGRRVFGRNEPVEVVGHSPRRR